MATDRVILHADMDAFYAAVEQRDRPELRGRPVVVGGTSDRGVVTAASYEARRFGIHSAMPTALARRRCPGAVFIHGDMAKYRRVGAHIRAIFRRLTPLVEPLSLDEAFLDLTGCERRLGPARDVARTLKRAVRAETALVVSVGIGPTKMIAKIASGLSKPDGLLEVTPAAVAGFLHPLPVSRLWGVGPRTHDALARAGIATVGALASTPLARLRAVVGPAADHLRRLALGEDARRVQPDRAAHSYGEESTFALDVSADDVVQDAIIAHAEAVARRLRRDHVRARTVVLKVKLAHRLDDGRFPLLTRRHTLATATDDGAALAQAALTLWTRHRPARPVRLIGVSAATISHVDDGEQLGLFADREREKRTRLNAALDRLAARFGDDSIRRGRAAPPKTTASGHWKAGEDGPHEAALTRRGKGPTNRA